MTPIDEDLSETLSDEEFCRKLLEEANLGIIREHPHTQVFNEADHAAEIRALARGMSIQEICDFYGISFRSLPEADKVFFSVMFLKGRVAGIHSATVALFNGMKLEKDGKSSLAYLKHFGQPWKGIDNPTSADNNGKQLKKVQVVLLETEAEED